MPFAIDANSSQAYFGEETALGVQSPGPFFPLEPNSYSDWGVDTKTVQRSPLGIARQQAKGTVTELNVAAGFQSDFTQNNLAKLMQGFFFASVQEKTDNQSTNNPDVLVSAVAVGSYTLASAMPAYQPNSLLQASNFTNAVNNGIMLLSAVTGAVLTAANVTGVATVIEAAPPVLAELKTVGFRLSTSATLSGLVTAPATLTDTGGVNFTLLGLNLGEWIYIGDVGNGVAASNHNFVGGTSGLNLRGYARISSIAATKLTFDFATFATGADTAAATVGGANIWFGSFIHNQNTLTTIVRRSYTLPRFLGQGIASTNQLETMLGCVPDKFTLNIAQAAKVTADLTFVGINSLYQNAAMLTGVIMPPFSEGAINTSQDLFASLLTVAGTESTSLFAYATDAKFMIDNAATLARALGQPHGFDVQLGDFKASASMTAYFDDIGAITAVQNNANVGYTSIFAKSNAGTVIDIPLLTLGGGKLKMEKDKKIMVDITSEGAMNLNGYTASYTRFSYLPNSAISGYTGL